MIEIAALFATLTLRIEAVMKFVATQPPWLALAIFLLPTWASLLTRTAYVIVATLVLNALATYCLWSIRPPDVALALALSLVGLAAALIVFGLHNRERLDRILELRTEIGRIRDDMDHFFSALDQRAKLVDEDFADKAKALVKLEMMRSGKEASM